MILLSTYSLTWYGLHRIFSFAKKAKYDGLDLYLTRLNYDLWDEDYIKSLVVEFDVPVLSITIALKWMNEKWVDKIMAIATLLWVQVVTFSPPHFWDSNINWFTRYLLRVKRDTHISIAVQNVEPKFIFFVIPEYKNATLSEIKKVTWDTTLDLAAIDSTSWIDILKAQRLLGSSIKNILLSDKHWSRTWLLPWMAGWWTSHLPLESFFMKLKSNWYNWFITLRIKPSEMWVWNEQIVLQNMEYLKKYYLKHFLNFK